jgi:hypothetical protein
MLRGTLNSSPSPLRAKNHTDMVLEPDKAFWAQLPTALPARPSRKETP